MARPYGLSVGPDGTIAVADPDAFSVHVFDVARSRYRRLREADGRPLVSPVGVAFDGLGRIYVADSVRSAVFRFDREGRWEDTLGGDGELLRPTGLAFDPQRKVLYVVDTLAHGLVGYDANGGRVLAVGSRGRGDGEFNYPVAVALDRSGRLYVTDSLNFRIQVLDSSGRFLHAFGGPGTEPGSFDKAKGIALDADGHIYVVEGLHDVVQVFDPEGRLLTVVGGTGVDPGEFGLPAGICIDSSNRILIADSANHRIQILRYLGEPEKAGGGS
jgi:sugar lactone lactonase YvrE